MLKIVLTLIGFMLLLGGLLWICQGTGIINWPRSSFMIDQRPWAIRGVGLAAVGAMLIFFGRR